MTHTRYKNYSLFSAPGGDSLQAEKPDSELPFYKFLEMLERSRQWTEKDVLMRLDIPRTTYRSWRDGTSEPGRRTYWIKLSQAFGVSVEALIRMDTALLQRRC